MFNGWRDRSRKAEKELISADNADIINGHYVNVSSVLRDADAITRVSALRHDKGITHSCPNCPPQFGIAA